MRKKKMSQPQQSEYGLYGGCVVCGAPFIVHEPRDVTQPPEVRPSCLCAPMAVFAAQMGEHYHMHRDA